MFYKAYAFNQPLGGWDVSKGTDFVSNYQSVGLKRSLLWLCFQLGCRVSQSVTHDVAFLDGRVLNQSLFSKLYSLLLVLYVWYDRL
jgi:hypothetical protein